MTVSVKVGFVLEFMPRHYPLAQPCISFPAFYKYGFKKNPQKTKKNNQDGVNNKFNFEASSDSSICER